MGWTRITDIKTSDYPAQPGDLVRCNPANGDFTVFLPFSYGNMQQGDCIGVEIRGNNPNGHKVNVIGGQVFPSMEQLTPVDQDPEIVCWFWNATTFRWQEFFHQNT